MSPLHIVVSPVILGDGFGLTVMVILPQDAGVPTQPPSPRAKYVVVDPGETIILDPVPAGVPPQELVYHCHWAAPLRLPVAILKVVD